MLYNNKLKKLKLESFHIMKNAKLMPFAGYMMPINYSSGIISEHLFTRSSCGLFDVSHMLQINIEENNNTIKKLEKIIPLDLNNLPIGRSCYSFILNNEGGIVDDLIISKLNNKYQGNFFYIVLNASRKDIDIKIFNEILEDSALVKERNDYSLIALQGPKSRQILKNIFPEINKLKFMEIIQLNFDDSTIIISCSGYTGEDGFELSVHNKLIYSIFEKLINNEFVNLCGLGSRDTLRLEAGLCLYGNELNENITPLEANLMWAISNNRKNKMDFFGSNKIMNSLSEIPNKIRVGLQSLNNSIPRSNFPIFDSNNKLIGKITSGSFSPSLKKPIAMGFVDGNLSNVGNEIFFEYRGKNESAVITKLPFIPHNYVKN